MHYEWFVGKRYLFSARQDRSISIITWISICGVALGVTALIVVTSLMNGFRDNLRRAIAGSLPHVTVFAWEDRLENAPQLQKKLQENPRVVTTAPYIFKQALLAGSQTPKGSLIRGIDPLQEPQVTEIASFLRDEIYPINPPTIEEQQELSSKILARLDFAKSKENRQMAGIILGASLAQNLNVLVGDRIKLISSEERVTPIGNVPRIKELEVIGIFESGISGYDEVLAFVDYRLVQRLYAMGDRVTGIGINVGNPEIAPEVAEEIKEVVDLYLVSNWAKENKSIFQVMELEKKALFLILILMVVVAAFNIISSLIMLVVEKSKEIAILKAIGATDQSIRRIFMIQGVTIGILGTFSGITIGLLICWILQTFNIIEIPPGVYPGGNRIPILIDWFDVSVTALCSFGICVLVTIYPSTKAARMDPIELIRYE